MRCANCDNLIKAGSRFCARCGHAAPGSVDLVPARGMLPAKSPMPFRGKALVAVAGLGAGFLLGGLFVSRGLLMPGLAIAGALLLVWIVGDLF